jgi:hypothetical protein
MQPARACQEILVIFTKVFLAHIFKELLRPAPSA